MPGNKIGSNSHSGKTLAELQASCTKIWIQSEFISRTEDRAMTIIGTAHNVERAKHLVSQYLTGAYLRSKTSLELHQLKMSEDPGPRSEARLEIVSMQKLELKIIFLCFRSYLPN